MNIKTDTGEKHELRKYQHHGDRGAKMETSKIDIQSKSRQVNECQQQCHQRKLWRCC